MAIKDCRIALFEAYDSKGYMRNFESTSFIILNPFGVYAPSYVNWETIEGVVLGLAIDNI